MPLAMETESGRRSSPPAETVVFVHGVWMTGAEMSVLRHRVRDCGYRVVQFRYPSVRRTPRENARALNAFLRRIDAPVIHLVAHSLGGIVVLHLFDAFPEQKPGRVVLIGTPVRGSAAARELARHPWLRPLLGASLQQGLLGDAPRWRGDRDLGIIAGTRGLGVGVVLTAGRLPEPNDGTVELDATRTAGVTDRLELPHGHNALLFVKETAEAVCRFLATGRFR